MKLKKYQNPILPGFYPDPSICRVGEDYYLVTSTFEYAPGLPIFHSKDLINWEQIGHGISRATQLKLSNAGPNGMGLFAPTIRYIHDRFYIVCTNVSHENPNGGNFLIWTDTIHGEWSNPIWLDVPGIDPSLFVDDDGTVYYSGTDGGIYLVKIDLNAGKTSERKNIWVGTGASDPEGPHLYKKGDYYYLLISEGGTSYGHMISMARSRHIEGPYDIYENNPVLTNRSTSNPLQAVGHADLFSDTNGNWWAVCLAIRPAGYPLTHILGRETCLVPVDWEGDWPSFGVDGHLYLEMDGPLPETESESQSQSKPTKTDWLSLYEKAPELIIETADGFILTPNHLKLKDNGVMAWVGKRQQHPHCQFEATVTLDFNAEVGVTTFLNPTHHYEIGVQKVESGYQVYLNRHIGSLWKIEQTNRIKGETLKLIVEGSPEKYEFYYQIDGGELIEFGQGETKYLSTEVGGRFTGVFLGVYASKTTNSLEQVKVSSLHYQSSFSI